MDEHGGPGLEVPTETGPDRRLGVHDSLGCTDFKVWGFGLRILEA